MQGRAIGSTDKIGVQVHGLGVKAKSEPLQGTRRACGMNEIASDIRRDVKVGRANST